MMKKYYLIALLSLFCIKIQAQDQKINTKKTQLLVGINTTRLLYNALSNGYSIDPIIKYKYDKFLFELEGGYTQMGMKRSIPNIDRYRNIGYYGRVGVNFLTYTLNKDFFSMGMGFIASESKEIFDVKIKGNIFGDYTTTYSRGFLKATAIDVKFQYVHNFSKKFYMSLGINPTYMLSFENESRAATPPEYVGIPYGYTVGMGRTLLSINDEDRPNRLTGSIQLQILYNLLD